jgi:hypothetical protein
MPLPENAESSNCGKMKNGSIILKIIADLLVGHVHRLAFPQLDVHLLYKNCSAPGGLSDEKKSFVPPGRTETRRESIISTFKKEMKK